jgi:hypothetical protein
MRRIYVDRRLTSKEEEEEEEEEEEKLANKVSNEEYGPKNPFGIINTGRNFQIRISNLLLTS